MRCEWKKETLNNLAKIVDSLHQTPNYTVSGFPMVRVTDIKEGFLGLEECVYVSQDDFELFTKKYKPQKDDIVVSRVGTYGVFSYVNTDNPFCLGQNTAIISPVINGRYLYYYLLSNETKRQIEAKVVGSTQKTLSLKNIRELTVFFPNTEEQYAIATTLSCLDDKIDLNNKINANLEAQAQAIFKSWFVALEPFQDGEFVDSELGPIPKGWSAGTFSDLIEKVIAGDWGKEEETGNYTKEVYCIRGADIPAIANGHKGKMPLRFILPKNYEKKKIENDNLVVEISGGSPTQSTGRIVEITNALLQRYDRDMVCTNFCKAVSVKPGYTRFVYQYWKYLYKQNVMFGYENGTTGIKNFAFSDFIEAHRIIIPPDDVVFKFNAATNAFSDMVYQNGVQSETLAALRDTLLPKLMSGEIEVPTAEAALS